MPDEVEVPALERARQRLRANARGFSARTISGRTMSLAEKRAAALVVYPDDVERPRTRGECEGGPRPCPWISCYHHLYLDVTETGAIKLNFPHLDPWEMEESCVLDVADRGGVTLEEVGRIRNVSRERIRQVEEAALRKMRRPNRDF